MCAACGNSGFRPPTNGTSPTTRERRRFEAPQWAVMIQRVVLIFTLVFAPSSSIPIPNSQIGITSFFLFFLPLHLFSSIALISARFYTLFFFNSSQSALFAPALQHRRATAFEFLMERSFMMAFFAIASAKQEF